MVSQALKAQRNAREIVTDKERREIALQISACGCDAPGARRSRCTNCAFFWATGQPVTYLILVRCEQLVLNAWRVRRAAEGGEVAP